MHESGPGETPGPSQTVRLRDGRALGYAEYGNRAGATLLYFHGHPGSRLEARFLAASACRAGVHLVGVDRPGMGLSTYQRRRRLLDWPDDVVQLADHLGIDCFAVLGFSGGGPYALACAYRIPHRLTGCGLVASVAPLGLGMALLARTLPWVVTLAVRRLFADPERAQRSLRRFARRWIEQDQHALNQPGVAELMAAALAEAFRQGTRGAAHDGTLLGRPWGFLLGDIGLPNLHLWHGELDREVPVAAIRVVAAELPSGTATHYPNEGHISLIVNHADNIVQTLTARRSTSE
jgi:pimeloyl-ACP methyl ester carboxylesterase